MRAAPLIQKIDAVTVPVPDLDSGLRFYRDSLGHELRWRHDDIGQAGLGLPASDTEIVLTTRHEYEPNWLVPSADEAARVIQAAGGRVITEPFDIPVGRVSVAADPFGNVLVLLDLSKGRYITDDTGRVTGVARVPPETAGGTTDGSQSLPAARPE
jgi:predicted enzyme related to lactoylglutathione lyase